VEQVDSHARQRRRWFSKKKDERTNLPGIKKGREKVGNGGGTFDGGGNIHAVGGGGASALAADGRAGRSTKEEGSTCSKPA
jgi:hypothetical protein